MDVVSVTIGLPVSDVAAAVAWYWQALELTEPELEPADWVVEFRVGGVWLQLGRRETDRTAARTVTRLGVVDVKAEWERLRRAGVDVGPLEHVPGAVDYFDFDDPDGNRLSMYTELE
jgi:lactoylglutathione lyase